MSITKTATKTVVSCDDCEQDLTHKVQYYPKEGGVLCENCNWRRKDDE